MCVVWVLFAGFGAWDVAARGFPDSGVTALVYLAAVSVVVYAIGWRPAVIADNAQAVIRNPLRTYELPWSRVTDIAVTYSLQVEYRGGVVRAWAADRGGAASNMLRGVTSRRPAPGVEREALRELARRSQADYARETMREIWLHQRGHTKGEVRITWAWPVIALFVVLATAAVVLTV